MTISDYYSGVADIVKSVEQECQHLNSILMQDYVLKGHFMGNQIFLGFFWK